MIGKGAPEDFVHNLEELAKAHHQEMTLDRIRAYYFGQRFIVEMEVVLPSAMTVRESHDIAMILQHKVSFLAVYRLLGLQQAGCKTLADCFASAVARMSESSYVELMQVESLLTAFIVNDKGLICATFCCSLRLWRRWKGPLCMWITPNVMSLSIRLRETSSIIPKT